MLTFYGDRGYHLLTSCPAELKSHLITWTDVAGTHFIYFTVLSY